MKLLDRIAYSNGNPQRTVEALRRLNVHLEHELSQYLARSEAKLCPKGLLARLAQTANQQGKLSSGDVTCSEHCRKAALPSTANISTDAK